MFIWWFSKNVVILSVGNKILILHLNYPNYSTMKNIIDRIIVLLFIFTMFFLMVVSAHAENRYFFSSQTMPSSIVLDDVTIMPTNSNGDVKNRPKTIFNENVTDYARVNSTATQFSITTSKAGVLLVYYSRSWGNGSTVNDTQDLKIIGKNGFAEYGEAVNGLIEGVKYYVLGAGTYTMTAENTCGVYGFVYMPGNVAAYNPKDKGDVSLFGQSCDSYANLPMPREENWYFGGWYKDEACTERVTDNMPLNEPTILFARWSRCVWDFRTYPKPQMIGNSAKVSWDGIVVHGSYANDGNQTRITQHSGLMLMHQGTKEEDCVTFTPEYDGELSLEYVSTNNSYGNRICAIGTDVICGSDVDVLKKDSRMIACEFADKVNLKTLHAKLRGGTKYYIYHANDNLDLYGIAIPKMQYVASASSAVVSGDNVSLTTTANMQGWRAFYDKDYSYTVDANTKVYMVVNSEVNGEVKFSNRTGNKVPKDCAVVLHTDALQADGTYLITMTKDATPYVYEGSDNLLRHSIEGEAVDAYRLGYHSGEGNGVAFYPWSTTNSSEGIVYLYQPNNNGNAKIAFEIEESAMGISSVQKEQNECNFVFNLNGQRMAVPRKGFNIINGKKYIVR